MKEQRQEIDVTERSIIKFARCLIADKEMKFPRDS